MQGERCLGFRIKGHASILSNRTDATAAPSSPAATSSLLQVAFPDHGQGMKNWKGIGITRLDPSSP
jgi:hypothetical protein